MVAAILGFAFLALVPGGAQKARVRNIPQNAFDIFKQEPKTTDKKTTNLSKRARAEKEMQQVGEQIVWEEIRNLFVPQRSNIEVRRQQEAAANIDSSTRFPVVTGIITDKDGDNRAILDGVSMKVGERLKDFIVKRITRDRVTLEGEDTYILELKPHQTPAVKIFMVPYGSEEGEIILTTTTSSSGPGAPTSSSNSAAPKPEGKGNMPHATKQ